MILAALGAVASLVGAGVNQVQANKATKKQHELNKEMENANDNEFYQNTFRNSLDAPTTKAEMTNIRRSADIANNARDNKNVAGNLTHEQRLASANSANNTVANAMNNAVQAQEARQASESERHITRAAKLNAQDQAYKGAEARNRANNVGNFIKAGAELANAAVGDAPKSLANKNNVNDEDEEDTAGNQFKSLNRSLFNTLGEPINPVSQPNEDSTQNAMAWNWLNNHSSKSISNRLNKGMFGNNLG